MEKRHLISEKEGNLRKKFSVEIDNNCTFIADNIPLFQHGCLIIDLSWRTDNEIFSCLDPIFLPISSRHCGVSNQITIFTHSHFLILAYFLPQSHTFHHFPSYVLRSMKHKKKQNSFIHIKKLCNTKEESEEEWEG